MSGHCGDMNARDENSDSDIPAKLKALRGKTGLSVREVAEKLGWPASTYSTYEGRYKKSYLPPEKARPIAELFHQYGVDRNDVLMLAGIATSAQPGAEEATRADANLIPVDYIATTVQALAENIEESGLSVTPQEQGAIVSVFCRWYNDQVIHGRKPQVLTVSDAKLMLSLLEQFGALSGAGKQSA
ncbi:XRE family transcriptional regulator (plasmid) [Azospirillum argentinense]|uniref:XRE family transcriptional regulator n=2 Tax=Azospirillaceae TaxID=2829815 RepID=A0A4D8PT14_9PROT|nr:XRE family transcriptional regulator [Azospirillum argentinense]